MAVPTSPPARAASTSRSRSASPPRLRPNDQDTMHPPPRLRIAFVHPDLGIGGAERLIVDAATGLQSRGHAVRVYTSHHDAAHCFPETRDGTLRVGVHGDWLPRSTLGRLHLVWAVVRHLWLCLILALRHRSDPADVYVVDQLSTGVPFLQRATGARVLFYCHFPDKLLASSKTRGSTLGRVYRAPLDWIEEATTGAADEIVVNSKFTRAVFRAAFPSIKRVPAVVYPGVPPAPVSGSAPAWEVTAPGPVFASINRFERKKNLPLALAAFARARAALPAGATLVLAGGFDPRVRENAAVLAELTEQAKSLNLTSATVAGSDLTGPAWPLPAGTPVVFVTSIPEPAKSALLARATALVYTPAYEHFGIVPVEAMRAGVPVVAVNNGGPAESVRHHRTGYLCSPAGAQVGEGEVDLEDFVRTVNGGGANLDEALVAQFALGMQWAAGLAPKQRAAFAEAARERVEEKFSRGAFIDALEAALMACTAGAVCRAKAE
ncbi:Alpha-1,3-mannosyltransferase-like protein [Blastocladiella emersonii ATCC 22665]|nr:Alpha-1,3-mannosyltransferase-like protein [Blastocladiella emersonii ATCC 22665]